MQSSYTKEKISRKLTYLEEFFLEVFQCVLVRLKFGLFRARFGFLFPFKLFFKNPLPDAEALVPIDKVDISLTSVD